MIQVQCQCQCQSIACAVVTDLSRSCGVTDRPNNALTMFIVLEAGGVTELRTSQRCVLLDSYARPRQGSRELSD